MYEDYLSSAVDAVLTWDIPEDAFAATVYSHASRLAGLSSDDMLGHYSNN